MIEEYRFGFIKINGKNYRHDVKVFPYGEVIAWQRKESHIINIEDIKEDLDREPELIVIGTGAYGVAKVADDAEEEIKKRGIELIVDNTEEAVRTFNIILKESKEEEGREKKVIGFFHLTC